MKREITEEQGGNEAIDSKLELAIDFLGKMSADFEDAQGVEDNAVLVDVVLFGVNAKVLGCGDGILSNGVFGFEQETSVRVVGNEKIGEIFVDIICI